MIPMNIVEASIELGKRDVPHTLVLASDNSSNGEAVKYRKAAERILTKLMHAQEDLEEANVDFTEIAKGLGRLYRELKSENDSFVPTTYVMKTLLPCIKRALDAKNSTLAIAKVASTKKQSIDMDAIELSLKSAMEGLVDFQRYLLSTKFHNDTTVQVKDVLYRILPVRDAIMEGLHNVA